MPSNDRALIVEESVTNDASSFHAHRSEQSHFMAKTLPELANDQAVLLRYTSGPRAIIATLAILFSSAVTSQPLTTTATAKQNLVPTSADNATADERAKLTIRSLQDKNPVPLGWLDIRNGVYPDDFIHPKDHGDDALAITRAIATLGQRGGYLRFRPRVYNLHSPIVQGVPVTWACIPSQNMGNGVPTEDSSITGGTWFHITQSLKPAITIRGNQPQGTVIDGCGFYESQPTPPDGMHEGHWTPQTFPTAISIDNVNGDVTIKNSRWYDIYSGITADRSNKITISGARAQWLHDGISIHHSYDVDRIYDIHVWGYGISGNPVKEYTEKNLRVISLYRTDTPFIDNIFAINAKSVLYIGYDHALDSHTPGGTATKVHLGSISCDQTAHCLTFDSGVERASLIASIVDSQSEDGAHPGVSYAGSSTILILSPVDLQLGDIYSQFAMRGLFENHTSHKSCSTIYIGSAIFDVSMSPNASGFLITSSLCNGSNKGTTYQFATNPTVRREKAGPWLNGSGIIRVPKTIIHP